MRFKARPAVCFYRRIYPCILPGMPALFRVKHRTGHAAGCRYTERKPQHYTRVTAGLRLVLVSIGPRLFIDAFLRYDCKLGLGGKLSAVYGRHNSERMSIVSRQCVVRFLKALPASAVNNIRL